MIEENSFVVKNISYVRARDPSIFAGSIFPQCSKNLQENFEEIANEEENDHIAVFVRLRDSSSTPRTTNLYEISNQSITCNIPETSQWYRNQKAGSSLKRSYKFSKVFPIDSSQGQIFNTIVKPRLFEFINGKDSTLLTYGVSGSGKTYTIMGTDENPGIVPRALEYLFKTIKVSKRPLVKPLPNGEIKVLNETESVQEINFCKSLISSNTSIKTSHQNQYLSMQSRLSCEPAATIENASDLRFEIWVQFAEIYNENIYDLFDNNEKSKIRPKLKLGLSNGTNYIKNLTTIHASTANDAYQLMQYGLHYLKYASTKLNTHSSRSHSIFTIKLVQISKIDNGIFISSYNFCDLAGSERSKKTMNVGERLKESNNINLSLLVLSRCMKGVLNSQSNTEKEQLPFRESKLTQLFQKALRGHQKVSMIVNVNLNPTMFDETLHVLHFGSLANDIQIDNDAIRTNQRKHQLSPMNRNSGDVDEGCGGSTGDYPHSQSTDRYTQELEDALVALQNELQHQQLEHAERTDSLQQRLIQGYNKILADKNDYWLQRLKEEKKELREEYEDRLEELKQDYEDQLAEQKDYYEMLIQRLQSTVKQEVIVISDSSDDDDDEKPSCSVQQLQKDKNRLEAENEELRQRLEELEKK